MVLMTETEQSNSNQSYFVQQNVVPTLKNAVIHELKSILPIQKAITKKPKFMDKVKNGVEI
jgi:hypothetical protein